MSIRNVTGFGDTQIAINERLGIAIHWYPDGKTYKEKFLHNIPLHHTYEDSDKPPEQESCIQKTKPKTKLNLHIPKYTTYDEIPKQRKKKRKKTKRRKIHNKKKVFKKCRVQEHDDKYSDAYFDSYCESDYESDYDYDSEYEECNICGVEINEWGSYLCLDCEFDIRCESRWF